MLHIVSRGIVLEIRDLVFEDSGEYECEMEGFQSNGVGVGLVEVRDSPTVFTSKPTVAFGQSYMLTWKAKTRNPSSRPSSWQLQIRKAGENWGEMIEREPDQMFYPFKRNMLDANSKYEVSVVAVRTDKNGRKILGKKSEFSFQVGRNGNPTSPNVNPLTTAAMTTKTASRGLKLSTPGPVQVKA